MNTPLFLVDPETFALPFVGDAPPIGVIDLDLAGDDIGRLVMPPFPLIGAGNPAHPLAPQLDAVTGSPVMLQRIVANARRTPETAAVAVQTLRLIEHLETGPALIAESLAYGLLQGSAEHAAWLASRPATPALPASPAGRVSLTRKERHLDIRLDRVGALNAIDCPMRDALREAFELAALDPEIDRVTMRGLGKAFSVGADLAEFGTTRDPATAHAIRMQTLPAHAIARCAEKLDVHIQGACVGSALEMASFARRVTAGPRAWFQLPELAMGLIPGAGGCVSISRRIGRQDATLLILSGRRIDARGARAIGLVDAIVDD
ncbi:enoyl-CoA hydratase/isomerase family protein [Sphingomonas oligophenolica]|uniref:Enoyl-CoA hydratase/isomerase family protein n=1 Tax=Sphingomonas oligophenolica TaxID=301154 RepID=A0ABU9XY51_9SPHN